MYDGTDGPERSIPCWTPDPEVAAGSSIAAFAREVMRTGRMAPGDALDYTALWRWSIEEPAAFWQAMWKYLGIRSSTPHRSVVEAPDGVESARWFVGAQVNFAEHALRSGAAEATAVVAVSEDGARSETTWCELRRQVAALASTLRGWRVRPGEVVVGYLPVGLPALVGMLAATAIGAVWAQCAQDYSGSAAVARLGQLDPVILVAADGYHYRGRRHDRRAAVAELASALSELRSVITVAPRGAGGFSDLPVAETPWSEATSGDHALQFEEVPFEHPLWVLFTSGTTGIPKGIVHGHGGVTLALNTFLTMHFDLGPDDVFFQYTSTNWMMWNVAVAALLTGATTILYDGSPAAPHVDRLWAIAAQERATVVGTSPGYLQACEKAGADPVADHDLSRLRILSSTGAALPPHAHRWIQRHIGDGVQVSSTSGGTDVVGAFAGTAPTTPVRPGELSAPCLGVDLQSWDPEGRPGIGRVGELVVTAPMPSMPLGFVGDPDGRRYHDAYFAEYRGVWRHGDWITVTERGTIVFHGRSDATLNRRGVRLGTAEIYGVVDGIDTVEESLVLGIELPDGDYWMPMFVVAAPGTTLTPARRSAIADAIRTSLSPRHVPDAVIEVPSLPHTKTGKRIEVPLKRIIQGTEVADALSADAIDDPKALEELVRIARTQLDARPASQSTKG